MEGVGGDCLGLGGRGKDVGKGKEGSYLCG